MTFKEVNGKLVLQAKEEPKKAEQVIAAGPTPIEQSTPVEPVVVEEPVVTEIQQEPATEVQPETQQEPTNKDYLLISFRSGRVLKFYDITEELLNIVDSHIKMDQIFIMDTWSIVPRNIEFYGLVESDNDGEEIDQGNI